MKKLDIKTVSKLKPNPIFKGLPEALKDPTCYAKIEKQIQDIVRVDKGHIHKTVKAYVKCKKCLEKYEKRKAFIRELGFTDYKQYMEWKKIMSIIISQRDIQLT